MTNRRIRIGATFAVALMLLAGIGIITFGSEESEAVTSDDIVSELVVSVADLYTAYDGGTDTYGVAYGSYISITATGGNVTAISTTYGDNAGLTVSSGNVSGMINKTSIGRVTLSVDYTDGPTVSFQVVLDVADLSSSANRPYTQMLHVPANLLYYQQDVYLTDGTDVLISGGVIESESDNLYEVVDVTVGSGLSLVATANGNKVEGNITDDNATVTVDVEVYNSGHTQIGTFSVDLHVVAAPLSPPTSSTPVAEIVMRADAFHTAYVNGVTSYNVAKGTYVDISDYMPADGDVGIEAITTTYSDNAGLTVSGGNLTGIIDKAVSGTITVEGYVRDIHGTDITYYVTLNVLDIVSTQTNPYYSTLSLPSNVFILQSDYYVNVGATVEITAEDISNGWGYYPDSVTAGYGLSVQSVSPYSLVGTISAEGDITVTITEVYAGDPADTDITIHAIDYDNADVRMIVGETWTYEPITSIASVVSVSGTASSWVSFSGGVVSGTAPSVGGVGTAYSLTITAQTFAPVQTVTQTVSFLVDPIMTISGPGATQSIPYGSGTTADLFSSNFEDGTRAIYSVTDQPGGYSIDAQTGEITYYAPNSGTVTVAATSPYAYTSGATNYATATVTFDVEGRLVATVSGTLYLVTGGSIPNTPAENVTLSHNNAGVGTYTWSIVGTNTTGVTVAADGTLGGTAGAVGDYVVTVRCTSVVSGITQTADAEMNVHIEQVLIFTSSPHWASVS